MTDDGVIKVTGKKKKPFADGISLDDIMAMDDWTGLNGGVLFNVEKNWMGRRAIFTLRLERGESTPEVIGSNSPKVFGTDRMKFVPPDTQPSMEFNSERTKFKGAFEYLSVQYDDYLYLLEPEYYDLLVLGAMSTYFREIFYTYPYFDFYAAEYNCGKTTAMKCLVWASFYGFLPLDPTGPVLFRAIDACHSAIGIDELDNVIQDEAGRSNVIGLLNAAYQKGTPAYRIDMERGGEVVPYDPFGMKSFTHTSALPDSFKSRSIVINMFRTPNPKAQLKTPEEFKDFRNMMYKLRMTKHVEVDVAYDFVLKNCGLINRDRDRFAPLLTMARLISDKLYDKILKWAEEFVIKEAPSSFDEVVRVLVEVLGTIKSGTHKLTDIRKQWNVILQEREIATKDYGSKTCQKKLRSLGFAKSQFRTGNRLHYEITPKRLAEWLRIYNINPQELVVQDTFDNDDNSTKSDDVEKADKTTDGSTLEHLVEDKESVIEVTESIVPKKKAKKKTKAKKRLSKLDKYILDHASGNSFSPAGKDMDELDKAEKAGMMEEESVGMWRLTSKGKKRAKELSK